MGSTTYYQTTMSARELANSVRPARESDEWASASIEERMQRDLNMSRVKSQIVPYLAEHADRLFGSFVVLVNKENSIEFESLTDVAKDLPGAYRKSGQDLGFITIDKGELIALDGQHRLMAFREVIGAPSDYGDQARNVPDDEVCVLLIEFESAQKTRRIFNKINRHAKPTGKSDNIVTSEDDGFAIVTRRLLDREREAPLAARELEDGSLRELVNWTSTTLTRKSDRITTLAVVYEAVSRILTFEGYRGFSEKETPTAPEESLLEEAYGKVAAWFDCVLTMDAFRHALENPQDVPEIRYSPDHEHGLLLRPVGQIALFLGLVKALERSNTSLSLEEVVARANKINWAASPTSMWRDTILRIDGRMVARKEAYELASDLIAYLIAPDYTDESMRRELWENWNRARGRNIDASLDEQKDEEIPEDLPDPVS